MSTDNNTASLNERIYREEPVIGGIKVRPFNSRVKMKITALLRLTGMQGDLDQESFFTGLYLIAAPIERVALNTLNREAYLVDREQFFADLPEAEFQRLVDWMQEVMKLQEETEVEVVAKPTPSTGETAPPNSSSLPRSRR